MSWDYWRLLTIVSLAGFVGLLFDQMMTFLFLAAFFYALWLQRSWMQLWHWLQKPKKHASPSANGVIDDVCRQIEQVRQQNNSRKKKLAGYLKRFQAATAALPDAIVVLGEYGQVEWANTVAKDLLGIRWPRDSNVRVSNLIRDLAFQPLLELPLNSGQVAFIASPLDPELQLEMKIIAYMGNGRLLIARDMTQSVKLQRMRRDFIANVSHELRTPLTVLRGYLETFTGQSPVEQWAASLPVMRQQTERMHLMIKDLLVLSQLETGEKTLRHEATDIATLLTNIVADARQLEQYQHHNIKLELDSNNGLLADEDELHSALSNLIFNAVKYTPPNSNITVRWRVDNKEACIEINDQGEGIAEYHLDRLTERFYRVDSGRTQGAGGTGLGLAIVKHVLQRHGAELTITSKIGEGSQFHCYFPSSSVVENSY